MFDALAPRPDVIYLMANSSLVFGPDPQGRSEEITFAGLVTVPKYPMPGYERRILSDGRQQIDIELTSSELTGESYLLGGTVKLGEHPDLRSLGTITESASRVARRTAVATRVPDYQLAANAKSDQQTAAAAQPAGTQKVDVTITPRTAEIIARNPDVLWDELLAAEIRKLNSEDLSALRRRPRRVIPPTVTATKHTFTVPSNVITAIARDPEVDWSGHLAARVDRIVDELIDRRLVSVLDAVSRKPPVIPNDFVVARKVLITTAKGVLYNETPVPVRGTVDTIPPVRHQSTADGVNVFEGMELPVPLLDADGNVDGWFYSKAHMAYAVLPEAIQRNEIRGTVRLRNGEKQEDVDVAGPVEIHLREIGTDDEGRRVTEVEVMVLALRGRSDIFGGEVMMIEAFSDRDRFSRGRVTWTDGKPSPLVLELFTEIYTPAGKLVNPLPISFEGSMTALKETDVIERGTLRIPLHSASKGTAMRSVQGSELLDESGRPAASIVSMQVRLEDMVAR